MFFQVSSNIINTAPQQVAAPDVLCTLLLYMSCCCCIFCFIMLVFALSIFNSECKDKECEEYYKGVLDLDGHDQLMCIACCKCELPRIL